jgi:hypothetical protein
MVKIRIPNINLKDTIITSLKPHLIKENSYIRLSSNNEIYIIENNNVFYIEPISILNKKNIIPILFEDKYSLEIDDSRDILIPIYSQIPNNYTLSKIVEYHYKCSNKALLKLVILKITELEKEKIQFFIECLDKDLDFNNLFFKEELNVFLSMLN